MAKDVKMNQQAENPVGNEGEKISIEMTKEQYEQFQNLEAEKLAVQKEKEAVEARIKEISDAEMNKIAKQTNKELKTTQKMVEIIIPISERNPDDLVVPVTINGYTYQIKRGQEVTVPKEVKRILKEAKYI